MEDLQVPNRLKHSHVKVIESLVDGPIRFSEYNTLPMTGLSYKIVRSLESCGVLIRMRNTSAGHTRNISGIKLGPLGEDFIKNPYPYMRAEDAALLYIERNNPVVATEETKSVTALISEAIGAGESATRRGLVVLEKRNLIVKERTDSRSPFSKVSLKNGKKSSTRSSSKPTQAAPSSVVTPEPKKVLPGNDVTLSPSESFMKLFDNVLREVIDSQVEARVSTEVEKRMAELKSNQDDSLGELIRGMLNNENLSTIQMLSEINELVEQKTK